MSQRAGVSAVKDEAVFLSGQLLVGGSAGMYLKSLHDSRGQLVKGVNFRTCGLVVFFLTVEAVGFQAYTGKAM